MEKKERVKLKKLYKFQPVNDQTLDNLENNVIWFSNPKVFNDPFEFRMKIDAENISDQDFYFFIGQLLDKYAKVNKKILSEQEINIIKQNKVEFFNIINKVFREKMEESNTKSGLACFSENRDNILMWSHYSEKHAGFCLEYDTSSIPFDRALSVSYQSTFPRVEDIKKILSTDPTDMIGTLQSIYTTKAECWSYEQEWRLIHATETNFTMKISPEQLSGIFLGSRMKERTKKMINAILKNKPTKIFQMVENKSAYQLYSLPWWE